MEESDQNFFAVNPKLNCDHIKQAMIKKLKQLFTQEGRQMINKKCMNNDCDVLDENWICLICQQILCSRYKNKHMLQHIEQKIDHCIAFSIFDASFWCFQCESYISNLYLVDFMKFFSKIKHSEPNQNLDQIKEDKEEECEKQQQQDNNQKQSQKKKEDEDVEDKIEEKQEQKYEQKQEQKQKEVDELEELQNKMEKVKLFSYDDIIENIKSSKIKKIVFLTGAGISTSCGIPDFRTPGTGLYYNLQKYNLQYPEQIFDLNYFVKNPKPFSIFCKELIKIKFDTNIKPSIAHKFISLVDKHKQLEINMTQNIDGLELKTDLNPEKLIQAHGHVQSAHCISCKKEYKIEDYIEHLNKDEVMKCNSCSKKNNGLIKPKIVFFGEGLPESFFRSQDLVKNCDLCFVMGTSLLVAPFNQLVNIVKSDVPIVVINRDCDEKLKFKKNCLFLEGNIDEIVSQIILDLGWKLE